MSEELNFCPSCSEKLTGVFNTNHLLNEKQVEIINVYFEIELEVACVKCGRLDEARLGLSTEKDILREKFSQQTEFIPILSIHSPLDWDYQAISIVTAQSVTGTGLFSDITSSWTDAFGMQSGTYNQKIRAGEDICRRSLRLAAIELGGNAVIAADVDYAEVGGNSAMLMVCMTGTAIHLKNPKILGNGIPEMLELGFAQRMRLRELDQLL